MSGSGKRSGVLSDAKVDIKLKLAALWVVVMFLYIYVDHFALFIPGVVENIQAGKVSVFEINQVWLMASMTFVTIPILMILLSLILKAEANRWLNIIVGILLIVVVVGNTIGEPWIFYIFASVVEVVLLAVIVVSAWKWPDRQRGARNSAGQSRVVPGSEQDPDQGGSENDQRGLTI
jgi:hypothetical protein